MLLLLQDDIYDALRDTLVHGCFSRFLNCTNATKSRIASYIYKNIYTLSEEI